MVGYKSVKRRHVAAILRRSHRRKEPEPEIKQEEEDMEEDFQHHSALGDDLFDVSPMCVVSELINKFLKIVQQFNAFYVFLGFEFFRHGVNR